MLFSTYLHLRHAKYFLYAMVDLALTFLGMHYLTDGTFEWTLFGKVYLAILGVQVLFVCRDGLVNFVFMQLHQQALIDSFVSEFKALGLPKEIVGLASSLEYFEAVQADQTLSLEARLGAAKYIALIGAIRSSASGWINHQMYIHLLDKSLHQFSVKD